MTEQPVCPCGYRYECPVHCGDGHQNGMCTPWPTEVDALIPRCPTCGNFPVESHPFKQVVRCGNCKEWLMW